MLRHEDHRRAYQELLRMRSDLAALNFMVKLLKLARWQAKFNPNQPRVPRGYENGGQWTDGDDYGDLSQDEGRGNSRARGSEGDSTSANDSGWPTWGPRGDRPRVVLASDKPSGRPVIIIMPDQPKRRRPGIGHNRGPALDPTPEVPTEEPMRKSPKLRLARDAARWILKYSKAIRIHPTAIAFTALLEATAWFAAEYIPYINAYLDGPKTLEELRDAVSVPARGTDVHHLVEQTPAAKENYTKEKIQGRNNLVRIPTIKHWEINSWYQRRQKVTNNQTPREYLKNKSWEEKERIGLEALKDVGVLVR